MPVLVPAGRPSQFFTGPRPSQWMPCAPRDLQYPMLPQEPYQHVAAPMMPKHVGKTEAEKHEPYHQNLQCRLTKGSTPTEQISMAESCRRRSRPGHGAVEVQISRIQEGQSRAQQTASLITPHPGDTRGSNQLGSANMSELEAPTKRDASNVAHRPPLVSHTICPKGLMIPILRPLLRTQSASAEPDTSRPSPSPRSTRPLASQDNKPKQAQPARTGWDFSNVPTNMNKPIQISEGSPRPQ